MKSYPSVGVLWLSQVVLLMFFTGCVVIPIPTKETKVLSGRPISPEKRVLLKPGETTREQVVNCLGPPSYEWEDRRTFAYVWDMRQAIALWIAGAYYTGAAGVEDVPKHYVLLIEFDAGSKMVRSELVKRPWLESLKGLLIRWQRDKPQDPGSFTRVESSPDPTMVVINIKYSIAGQPRQAFINPRATNLLMFATGLGSFGLLGEPLLVAPRFLSERSRREGWAYFQVKPGISYLALLGPDSYAREKAVNGISAAPRWRIDVPAGAKAVYAGSLRFAGQVERRRWFGVEDIGPAPDSELLLDNDSAAAREVIRALAPNMRDPITSLMKRWHPGEPIVLSSPQK